MAEVEAVAQRVREHWLSQGLGLCTVEPDELAAAGLSHPEGIPADYAKFLRIAGLPDREDKEGFRFWLPKELDLTRDVLRRAGYESAALTPSLIFADYLQESWWYALWLGGPFAGQVSLVLGDARDPQPAVGTLADFLVAYLNDDALIYPPARDA